ncbi:MAG TPA: polysaccharide deacetylase family protein, partial [Gemmatimonadales bacterium]|nr:polysaccharide deacetylase family protein [Gemmatimonadales bacterium]
VGWPVWGMFGAAAVSTGVLLDGPPVWLVDRVAASFPGCLYRVRTQDRLVALTLDDGPDERTTPLILDQLRRHGARATFFLIGERVAGREALVRRLVEEGHEVGNHLMRDRAAIRLSAEELSRDLDQSHALLTTLAPVRWARPGSGWYSRETVAAMERKGYRCALGSVYPYDATIPSSGFAVRYILRNVRPGAVIVLHEGDARGRRTARTLGIVLPELGRSGYRVVALSELALAASGPPLHRDTTGGGPRPTSTTLPQRGSR